MFDVSFGESLVRRQATASQVSVKGKAQRNYVVLRDVDKNWGKRGIPLGTPNNFKGLRMLVSLFYFVIVNSQLYSQHLIAIRQPDITGPADPSRCHASE